MITSLETTLEKILSHSNGERKIHNFLKENPLLVINAFSRSWNARVCVPEFEFGNEYRADFLLLNANSGYWIVTFIELEPPNAKLYLKDATPSKTLRIAQRQIEDWKDWVRKNENYLRQSLSNIVKKEKVAAQCSLPSLHQLAETEILDQRTVINYHYHIVIGRMKSLSIEEQERRKKNSKYWSGPEIATYDRMLSIAKAIDITQAEIAKAHQKLKL